MVGTIAVAIVMVPTIQKQNYIGIQDGSEMFRFGMVRLFRFGMTF